MSQVSPGDDGSTRRTGAQARKGAPAKGSAPQGSPAKRPPAKAVPKGRPPGGASKGRPPTDAKGRPQATAGAKGRAPKPNMKITAPPPRRFSPSTMAFVAIGVVVAIILVFVVVKLTSGSTKASTTQLIPDPSPAAASLVSEVTSVPQSVFDAVGIGTGVTAPTVLKGQPPITPASTKPQLLFIGAEFCPYCAAERWSMVVALSRFGTWSGLKTTTSSLWDSDPGTATFSFRSATLTSPYLNFVGVEHQTNDDFGAGTRTTFQPLTAAQSNIWQKYSTHFGEQPGYPFLDFENKIFVLGPSYDPAVLQSLDQQEIAAKLDNPNDPVTQRIVGTANYLTASACAITGNKPAAICSASGTRKAAAAMKLS